MKTKVGKRKIYKVFMTACACAAVALATLWVVVGFGSCSMIESFDGSGGTPAIPVVSITGLSMGKTSLEMKVGSMDYVSVSVKPQTEQKNVQMQWSYDNSIIECDTSSNWGVTIKGLKEGQTSLRCSCAGFDAACLITISGYEQGYEATVEPYIYSNTPIVQTVPGGTERVFVSLYGGDASDIDGFVWTNEDNTVCAIQPTGQYCLITGKAGGYSRIKVTHASKAKYAYYVGVYVFDDPTKMTYITTGNNILTMNKDSGEQSISVALVNGKETSRDADFTWQIMDCEGSSAPVGVSFNGNNCVVTPVANGSCTIRVQHPDAAYPLDILCRVITIVKNVYIQPDATVVELNGEETKTVTCLLENIKEGDYSVDDYEFKLDSYDAAGIVSWVGNQVMLKGKANGSAKLLISHPKAAYSREVLLIVTGQLTDAVDASHYITTSQNYIRTKVGAEPTKIFVSLKGGLDGDENDFVWSVKSTPKDESSNENVVELETANGSASHLISRSAAPTYLPGTAIITPKAEGTAVITIGHKKVYYTTEILVKVLNKDAILESPLYFVGSGLVKVLNGESYDYSVELRGDNKTTSDDGGISWKIDDSRFSVAGNENRATITAPQLGTGQTRTFLTASHVKADADKKVLVMTADTIEELKKMKALYSDKLYYNFEVGQTVSVMCLDAGFYEDLPEGADYDWSLFQWTVSDPSVVSVDKNSDNPRICSVKGLKAGAVKLTGSIVDSGETYSCEFTLTVLPKGSMATEPEVYFTTAQNVVSLVKDGSAVVNVSAINMPTSKHSQISWTCSDTEIASVIPNGCRATVRGVKDGETVINVSHPDSQNILKIYVRVGSEYVIKEAEPVIYIAAQDVITMLKDDPAQKLQASLVNYSGAVQNGFSFEIDNEAVAVISNQSQEGIAFIKPVGSGQAQVTIRNPATSITKKVLVVVGNSAEELAGFTYLTTGSNVVAIGEGGTRNVSVQVKNAETIVVDGYDWTSNNPSIVDVTSVGATATLKGNSIGTAIIKVTNTRCKYPLEIIAQVVDPITAAASPYIQLDKSVLTLTVGNTWTDIAADLVGGDESDKSGFVWTSENSTIATVYGQNEVGKLKAVSDGTTYITVRHPKARYEARLLCVCENAAQKNCSISVPSSIISMKPTDAGQTITATLINGTGDDKYNFKWSMDVYDIVDLDYSANVAQITPKQAGNVTLTVHHPKAAYDQQIVIKVQQYATFAFPSDNMTITQGDVQFVAMQVPVTNVSTHVEYSVENDKICKIVGTKATAQLTGIGTGTTTVKARLVANGTGIEQARAEMMVFVKEKDVNAVYITAPATITTVNKGKSQTISAQLIGTGVVTSDQQKLKWTTSDSDIVQVAGIGVDGSIIGQSIYITALKPGEAVITCSHEKAASNLQFYVVVPGTAEKIVILNKTSVTMLKGSSGVALKATIENSESYKDYYDIMWTVDSVGSEEVCRIAGSGQNVQIIPINVGRATIMAQLPDTEQVAKCDVIVEASKSFTLDTQTTRVHPFHTKKIKYTVSPPTAELRWTVAADDDYFSYNDLGADDKGVGYVEIEGIKEGTGGKLVCVTDGGAKGTLSVRVAWDYEFAITGDTAFTIDPNTNKEISYRVSPADANIRIDSTELERSFKYELSNAGEGKGTVKIIPLSESDGEFTINLTATNPAMADEIIGTRTIRAKFLYNELTPVITIITSNGQWSRWNDDAKTFIIGDGETVVTAFSIKEENARGSVSSVTFKPNGGNNLNIQQIAFDSDSVRRYNITNGMADKIVDGNYRIDRLWVPADGSDWRNDYCWVNFDNNYLGRTDSMALVKTSRATSYYTTLRNNPNEDLHNDPVLYIDDDAWMFKRGATDPGLREELSAHGMELTESEFKNCAWLYCPGTAYGSGRGAVIFPISPDRFARGELIRGPFGVDQTIYFGEFPLNGYDPIKGFSAAALHVTYTRVPTTDTSVTGESGFIGELYVTVQHNGRQKIYKYPVYNEVRNCVKECAGPTGN